MIGKLIAAYAGSKMAKSEPGGMQGTGGALLGVAAAALARRMSWPALLAMTAGGYLVKKAMDGKRPGTTTRSY